MEEGHWTGVCPFGPVEPNMKRRYWTHSGSKKTEEKMAGYRLYINYQLDALIIIYS